MAYRKIKLNPETPKPVIRKLRLDKIKIKNQQKSELQKNIENFLLHDENSIVVPDVKKVRRELDLD